MKLSYLLALGLGMGILNYSAQGQPRPSDGPPRGGRRMPVPPLMAALDTNTNGVIDAAEIANNGEALKKLDRNGDGQISRDEVMPGPPRRQGQFNAPPRRQGQFNAPPPAGRPPVPPFMKTLDANKDKELDATEIANASSALLKLDANNDGKLTRNELRPKGQGGPKGSFRPGRPGYRGGPRDGGAFENQEGPGDFASADDMPEGFDEE